MDERARRIGMNEAVFRDVNERIEALAHSFGLEEQPLDLMCECGNASCMQQIRMTAKEYDELRSDPHLFAFYPGHEAPDVEDIVESREGYDIVRKREGAPARIAEETDPRH